MKVWNSPSEVPDHFQSVITIGNFDGVHVGHARVIAVCVERARRLGIQAVACTFDPHPLHVHHPEMKLALISPLNDRLDSLSTTGLDATMVLTYDEALYSMTPEEFVQQVVVNTFGAAEVIVGEDFRFGLDNSGDIETLRELGKSKGFNVVMVADIVSPQGRRLSSSWIRELLASGDVAMAAQILGHNHRIRGVVEHGFKRGRQLGFPTANLSQHIEGVLPADGVYAGWLVRSVPNTTAEEFYPAAISVGTNPQFDGVQRTVEAHVLGRADLQLYGETIGITFTDRLRSMRTFDDIEQLLVQMDDDLRRTAGILGVGATCRIDPSLVTAQ